MSSSLRTHAGPWCGGLTDTSVVIRASVLRSVTRARVLVGEDEQFAGAVDAHEAESLWMDPDRAYPHQIATFRPVGLRPDTTYHYRLEIDGDGDRALPGRFTTAPALGQPAGFRFAFSGCARPPLLGGVRPEAYRAIADLSGLLFFAHLGDLHYRDIGSRTIHRRLQAYDDTLRRDSVGDLFRRVPLVYCWDDHDFLGNNAEGGDPRREGARRFARDAYDLYVPHYPLASTTGGVQQAFQVGRVRFLLTDCRYDKSPRRGSGTSGKSVLGANQKAWLKGQLLAARDLDLIVWASSLPWIGAEEPGEDFWAGYAHERAELAQFLVDHDIRNVCMISADAHMLAIDDGRHGGYAAGGRGGFPVFQAAALESAESEKGGPYSLGRDDRREGPGIAGRRQFGVCQVVYDGSGPGPRVIWTGFRAAKESAALTELLRHEFHGHRTFEGF